MERLNDALSSYREEIGRLDRISRQRALSDGESLRLEHLLNRQRYHRRGRSAA